MFQGYFRKGCAQFGMDLFEDAIVSLLQCLALDTEVKAAKDYLSKVNFFLSSVA